MAFGMDGNSANIIIRNWLTFLLRECIIDQERTAYKNQLGLHNILEIQSTFEARMKTEILRSYEYHKNKGTVHIFKHTFRANGQFLKFDEDIRHYTFPKPFQVT